MIQIMTPLFLILRKLKHFFGQNMSSCMQFPTKFCILFACVFERGFIMSTCHTTEILWYISTHWVWCHRINNKYQINSIWWTKRSLFLLYIIWKNLKYGIESEERFLQTKLPWLGFFEFKIIFERRIKNIDFRV